MKLSEIQTMLEAQALTDGLDQDLRIDTACSSDLMSDVLCFSKPGCLLLTGLTTPQVVYTAEMAEVTAICFVRGKRPSAEVVRLARSRNIVLLQTQLMMFACCGRLYGAGVKAC